MRPTNQNAKTAQVRLNTAMDAPTVTHPNAPRHKEWDVPSGRLMLYRSAIRNLEAAIEYEVDVARDAGISWDAIAYDLGTTRQGAWQRYGRRTLEDAPPA